MSLERKLALLLSGLFVIVLAWGSYSAGMVSQLKEQINNGNSGNNSPVTPDKPNVSAADNSAAVLAVIHARKSVRNFIPRRLIGDADMEKMLRAAMAAPSASNRQPWQFVVLNTVKSLDAFTVAMPEIKYLKQAGAVIVVCGDMTKIGNNNRAWPADLAAASQNILLAAEAIQLGGTWCGCYPSDKKMLNVRQALHIPDSVVPFSIIVLGYPDGRDLPAEKWNPSRIHYQTWQKK